MTSLEQALLRLAAQDAELAELRARLRDAQEDEARALNDAWNYLHEVKSAASAVRLARQHAESFRTQRNEVLRRLGEAHLCGCKQEVAA